MKVLLKPAMGIGLLIGFVFAATEEDIFIICFLKPYEQPTTAQVQRYVFKLALVEATAQNVAGLKLPAGFRVNK